MQTLIRSASKILAVMLMCLMIVACNKVTRSNFDKVKPEMTMSEVTSILGEPTSSDSVTIAGMSGTSAVWKYKQNEIMIQFLNDKVYFKTFSTDADK